MLDGHADNEGEEMIYVRLYDENGDWEVVDPINLKATGRNRFKGWKCSVGQRNLYIDWDGNIFRGTCRMDGQIGNVYDEIMMFPDGWVTCDKSACNCVTEIQLPKAKDLQDPEKNSVIPMQDYPVYIQWDISRRCNFDCSYCPSFVHNTTDEFQSLDILKDVVVRLQDSFGPKMTFNFAGGEPTVHPDFIQWCEFIKKLGHRINVQTNGAQVEDYWRRLARTVDHISISVHLEFMTEKRLMKTINAIMETSCLIEVKIMAHPNHWEKAMQFKRLLQNVHLNKLMMLPLRTSLGRNTELMDYTSEQLREMGTINTPD